MKYFNPKTVTIGNQVWMAENLALVDGEEGIYHNLENNEYYYTYDAAMRIANSIPGWHLPSAIEWNDVALACGAIEVPYKGDPNFNYYEDAQELKDKLGVKLAGYQNSDFFYNLGSYAYFWTATEYSSATAYYRYFSTGASMDSGYNNKTFSAYSVRLVKDSENSTEALEAQIPKLENSKKALEDTATVNASMLSAYERECKTYKSRIQELENETKHMENLARTNKILEEQNLAYKKLLETKDAEIAEIRRSTDFYMNYYREDKEVHRPAMREVVRKLKDKIKEMEG